MQFSRDAKIWVIGVLKSIVCKSTDIVCFMYEKNQNENKRKMNRIWQKWMKKKLGETRRIGGVEKNQNEADREIWQIRK